MDDLELYFNEQGVNLENRVIKYAKNVLNKKIKACRKHRLSCKRFLKFIETKKAKVAKGYSIEEVDIYFDKIELVKLNEWAKLFKHTKGVLAGQSIILDDWQLFILSSIFCIKRSDTNNRLTRKAYIQVGRKNAKTQLLAIICSYFGYNSIQLEEIYIAGWGRDQSDKCFKEISLQLKGAEGDVFKYQQNWTDAYHHIEFDKNGTTIYPLSKEARKTGDGSNPSLAVIDEYHCHETNEIVDSLSSGNIAREDSLYIYITTAGFDLNGPCYQEYLNCSAILDEDNINENDEYFIMICELDSEKEIDDPSSWIKANPIVCSYEQGRSNLFAKYKDAIDDPIKLRSFLTKNMNIWVDKKDNTYIENRRWNENKIPMPNIIGQRVYVGSDLSNKIDLCSHGFEFPELNFVMQHSFIPEDILWFKIKQDRQPYDLWVKQGYITLIEGSVIDDDVIIDWLENFIKDYELKPVECCYDPWSARQYSIAMMNKGYTMVEVRQGLQTLSEPTKDFREKVYSNKIYHCGDPVLQFAINNAICKNTNGNIMIDKDKSRNKIDPLAAIINAHTRAMYDSPIKQYDPNEYASEEMLNKLWGG